MKPALKLLSLFGMTSVLTLSIASAEPDKDHHKSDNKSEKAEAKSDQKDEKKEAKNPDKADHVDKAVNKPDHADKADEKSDHNDAKNGQKSNKDIRKEAHSAAKADRKEDQRDRNEKLRHENRDDRRTDIKRDSRERFQDRDRDRVVTYFSEYKGHDHGLPPGLAKKWQSAKRLPSGWRDRVVSGYVIEPDWRPAFQPIPYDWFPGIAVIPETRLYWYGDRVVRVYEPNYEVMDVIIVPTIHIDL